MAITAEEREDRLEERAKALGQVPNYCPLGCQGQFNCRRGIGQKIFLDPICFEMHFCPGDRFGSRRI